MTTSYDLTDFNSVTKFYNFRPFYRSVLLIFFLLTGLGSLKAQSTYCLPAYTTGCADGDQIVHFSTNGGSINISNTTNGCSGGVDGYGDFTSMSASVSLGSSFGFSVQSGPSYSQGQTIWIDWNQDYDFNDAGEQVWQSNGWSTALQTGTINVPNTAIPGTTRMRVRCNSDALCTSPCAAQDFGEAEDYSLLVLGTATNDAGVTLISSPSGSVCPGTYTVSALIQNYGVNPINPISVGWSIDGTSQTPYNYTSILDTFNGAGQNTATVNLGNITLSFTPLVLKVWTYNPNNTVDTVNVNDTITLQLVSSLSGSYTIDTAAGADFTTIQDAVVALENFGVCNAVTFLLGNATFNENIEIGMIPGVSSTNTVTFASNPLNASLANQTFNPANAANNFLWKFNNASYIILDGLNLTTNGTSFSRIIEYSGNNDNITIRNCNLNGFASANTSTARVVIFNTAGISSLTNNCVFENNTITGGSYSVLWDGGATNSLEQNNKFINNRFENYYLYGVYSRYQNNCEFLGNYFESAGTYNSATVGYNLFRNFNDGRSHVIGNTFNNKNRAGSAIEVISCDATSSSKAKIVNNFIAGTNVLTNGAKYGIKFSNSKNQRIVHNSVCIIGGNANGAGVNAVFNATSYSGNEFKNNIISNTGATPNIYFSGDTSCMASDYNVFNYPNSTLGYYNTAYATLTALQVAGVSDTNSIYADPYYVDPTNADLHIGNILLDDAAPYSAIFDDIDGDSRSSITDFGADEKTFPLKDVMPISIVNPVNPLCSNAAEVEVVIYNNGQQNLTSAVINFSINNGSSSSISWTGNVNAAEFDTASIGTLVFNDGDTLTIWTSLPNAAADPFTQLDTISLIIELSDTFAIQSSLTQVNCNGNSTGAIALSVTGTTSPYLYSWSNGNTLANNAGLSAGAYSVQITDVNGCSKTKNYTISEPSVLSALSISSVNATCFGLANGSAQVVATGGVNPYAYAWNNGVTSASNTAIAAGNYVVTVSDANGCTTTASTTVNQPSTAVSLNVTGVNLLCNNDNSGSAVAVATGGTGTLSYSWNTGATTTSLSSLSAGNYAVTVLDANGCSINNSITISQPNVLSGSISNSTNVSCYGLTNGSISVAVTGGATPYAYNWSNGNTIALNNNLGSGSYTLTVTDNNNCTTVLSSTITAPADSVSTSVSSTNLACFGDNSGSAAVSASGGTGTLTYAWSNGASSAALSSLPAGVYSVTVADANGCSKTNVITLTQPALIAPSLTSSSNASCYGSSDGAIEIAISGGLAPYSQTWNNGATSLINNNLSAGAYSVLITDASGCNTVFTANVNQPDSISIAISGTNLLCNGDNSGAVSTTATGGTGTLIYSWSNGATTTAITSLVAGSYIVTVTDVNACTNTAGVTITEPILLGASIVSVDSASCYDFSDGTIEALASGGSTPYSYTWNNSTANAINTGLNAGLYSVTITDINGCDTILSASVDQPDSLNVSISGTNLLCNSNNSGAAIATATGGTGTLNYNWSNGQTTSAISSVAAGMYTITVIDANGCSKTGDISISEPTVLSATVIALDSTTCYGTADGSIDISSMGGVAPYTYSWSNSALTSLNTGLIAGVYTVTVTDANSCDTVLSATVQQPDSISVLFITTHLLCNNDSSGTASVVAGGGTGTYSYTWSNGETTSAIDSLDAGNYTVSISDANNCIAIATGTANEPDMLGLNLVVTDAVCSYDSNGEIVAAVNGGVLPYSYDWSIGDTNASAAGLAVGNYQVTITDANGCMIMDSASVANTSNAIEIAMPAEAALCLPFTITLESGVEAESYAWSTGESTASIDVTAGGLYTVTIGNAEGCLSTDSTTVIEQPCVGIAEGESAIAIDLYPNPNRGEFTLNINNASSDQMSYTFMSLDGKLVKSGLISLNGGNSTEVFQFNGLSSGLYIMSITTNDEVFIKRVIIE
jgi:hypothetical protein